MKIVKRIIFIIVTVILGLVLIFNLYNVFCIKVLKQKLPSIGGYAILEVVSGSMEPTIKVGDLIIINKNAHDYTKDDIITFTDVNGAFVTHRIMEINKDEMITKGDNNNTEDEAMPMRNIVGKYIFRIAGLGTILSSLKNPLVSIMILIIGILICYLVSTDKEGNPLPEKEQEKFSKYLANKEENKNSKLLKLMEKIENKFKKKKVKPKKKKGKRKKGKKQNYKNKKRK